MKNSNQSKPTHWSEPVHSLLREHQIKQVAMVPDAGHANLIRLCEADKKMKVVRLTSEKGILLMQSSGVGNCINMLSLSTSCQMPLVILITMRGDHGEFNPSQVPMGNATETVLSAMGVLVRRGDTHEAVVEEVAGALHMAFNTSRPIAVLIGQKVTGAKDFRKLTH
ncbi:MAG: phosphonopyruvate decarboxylase [Comamonadaceae bacterium]|nr:phosphonopyruvate decarboxylase [Comamonadaceae bacterium]